jgi:uncharacterized membrane-anchored protein YhcB (DUF1043 family)
MFDKRKMKSMGFVEVFLILFFIILVTGILYFTASSLAIDALLYNGLVIGIIILTIIVASIAVFQFIKVKYTRIVITEVKEELENYKIKLGNKTTETNNRIVYFEANYSKQLKKIMKDYSVKAKEIEEVKKALNAKLVEIDRKAAELEVETCIMKVENLKGKTGRDIKERKDLYHRIIVLSDRYPGICTEEFLSSINVNMKDF